MRQNPSPTLMHAPARVSPASAFDRLVAWATEPASFRALSLALLVPMLAFFLPTSVWTGNEENYFQLALRRVAPDAFSPWHAVFDYSNGRFVSEYLYGLLIKAIGYESAHTFARIGTAALYSGSLAALFASVRLSIVEAVAAIIAFRLLGEQILGGEWLFQGAEPKTLAYALVFVAMALANRDRWYATAVAAAGATSLHFLVGGFWSLALGLCALWRLRHDWPSVARVAGLYLLLIVPVLLVLAQDQLGSAASALPMPHGDGTTLPSADQIYAWRSAHHVSPFVNPALMPQWLQGIGWLAGACALYLLALRLRAPAGLLMPLVAIGLGELVLALGISYIDQERLAWAKFYLFRPSSVTLLLLVVVLLAAIRDALPARLASVLALAMIVATLRGLQMEYRRDRWELNQPAAVPHQAELLGAVHGASGPDDVVVFDPSLDLTVMGIRLNRAIERPTVVAPKFVPTAPHDLQRWHMLLSWRERLFQHGCEGLDRSVPVKLVVTFSADARGRVANCGPEIWRRDQVAVTRIGR
jgi:hypothetical protein